MVVMVILIGWDFDFPVPGKVWFCKESHICLMVVLMILIGCEFDFPVPGKVWSCKESHTSHLSDGGDGDSDWMWFWLPSPWKSVMLQGISYCLMVVLIGCDFDFPVPEKVLCFKGFHVCRMMVILIACNFDFPVPGKVLFYEQIHCLMIGWMCCWPSPENCNIALFGGCNIKIS